MNAQVPFTPGRRAGSTNELTRATKLHRAVDKSNSSDRFGALFSPAGSYCCSLLLLWPLAAGNMLFLLSIKRGQQRTALVAQWLEIRLPIQGTLVPVLVREDPTCHGATKPVRHNYRACALEPASHNY